MGRNTSSRASLIARLNSGEVTLIFLCASRVKFKHYVSLCCVLMVAFKAHIAVVMNRLRCVLQEVNIKKLAILLFYCKFFLGICSTKVIEIECRLTKLL